MTAALLAELWSYSAQDGTITGGDGENEPDYLDAIDLGLRDHDASLDEAWVAFSTARWFVGTNDDGAHITGARAWSGGEPFVDSAWTAADLPLVDQPAAEAMAEYSSSFMTFAVEPAPGMELLLEITGSDAIAWGGTALALQDGASATEHPLEMSDAAHGHVRVPLEEGLTGVVLSVAALGDGAHDPENHDVNRDYDYTVSASLVEAPPEDTAAPDTPAEEGGCACSSTHTGWACLFPALLGLLGLGVRRRR